WGEKAQNSATISIIIALFTIVPAICYLLSAIIAKRYYSLTTHNLKTVMEQLAQGKRRCQQQFTSQNVQN
ncbi:glycoside-pentoside-hexuronide family transporter, partial [Escherichia coli]|nr:glycoside-pentoside-hexuronide family transporter [Escherichia coli]